MPLSVLRFILHLVEECDNVETDLYQVAMSVWITDYSVLTAMIKFQVYQSNFDNRWFVQGR